MIRTVLALSATVLALVLACHKEENKPPDLTTVVKEPGGKCVGYETCPPADDQHITATLEPKTVTSLTEVPSTSLSPTSTEVPTVSPSPTSTVVPTVIPTS